jgi:hypothetical protein
MYTYRYALIISLLCVSAPGTMLSVQKYWDRQQIALERLDDQSSKVFFKGNELPSYFTPSEKEILKESSISILSIDQGFSTVHVELAFNEDCKEKKEENNIYTMPTITYKVRVPMFRPVRWLPFAFLRLPFIERTFRHALGQDVTKHNQHIFAQLLANRPFMGMLSTVIDRMYHYKKQ